MVAFKNNPTESVSHSGDSAGVQVHIVCEVWEHHGQMRAPVTPPLLSTALYTEKNYISTILKNSNKKKKWWIEDVQLLKQAFFLTSVGT